MVAWLAALAVCGGFIGAFLGGYARKKGENLATRQDVLGIEGSIQGIKLNHEKQFESFRSDLALQFEELRRQSQSTENAMASAYLAAYEMVWFASNTATLKYNNNDEIAKHKEKVFGYAHDIGRHFFDILIYASDSSENTLNVIYKSANLFSWSIAFTQKVWSMYEHLEAVNHDLKLNNDSTERYFKEWNIAIKKGWDESSNKIEGKIATLAIERENKLREYFQALDEVAKSAKELIQDVNPLFDYIASLCKIYKAPEVFSAIQAILVKFQQDANNC